MTGRRCIGPSGAVSNQGPVLNLSRRRYGPVPLSLRPWLLLSANALSEASRAARPLNKTPGASASAIQRFAAASLHRGLLPHRSAARTTRRLSPAELRQQSMAANRTGRYGRNASLCSYRDARIRAMIVDCQPRITALRSRLSHLENTIKTQKRKIICCAIPGTHWAISKPVCGQTQAANFCQI